MADIPITITLATADARSVGTSILTSRTSQPHRDPDTYNSLSDLLFDKMNIHPDEKNFLTLNCLQELLPTSRVRKYLQHYSKEATKEGHLLANTNIEHYLELICKECQHEDNLTETKSQTYIRLFALLALINRGACIFMFIDGGICDQTLPIFTDENLQAYTHEWGIRDTKDFCLYKWRVSVPFLAYGKHREFPSQVVMPFIGDLASGSSDDEPDTLGAQTPSKHKMETRWGGFGDVYFVRIHPNSHNFQGVFGPLLSPEGPFALKKLRGGSNNEQNEKEFKKEEEMLTRFDGTVHPHIVTILMTYKHGNRYCFLFPRAECDLIDYFEQNPSPKNDLKTARWLAKQCLHLTEAVHLIHNPPKQDSLKPDKRKYGRHGDIKAENILLFKSNSNEYDLVLSDFGLGSMHHDWSKSNIPNKDISATPEFRPPECEMEGGCISRAFDIWTLGCLFLDLLTWFLGGEELRLQFQKKRTTPYIRGPDTPLYFEVVKTKDERHGFIVKEQVKDWFAEMHRHSQCTSFVHEFLDLIEKKMLIVESQSEKRARTGELLKFLNSFHSKCNQPKSEDYCLTPRPNSSRSTIPPIAVEGSLSEITKERITKSKTHLRKFHGPTQRAEQIWEDGDELLENLQIRPRSNA